MDGRHARSRGGGEKLWAGREKGGNASQEEELQRGFGAGNGELLVAELIEEVEGIAFNSGQIPGSISGLRQRGGKSESEEAREAELVQGWKLLINGRSCRNCGDRAGSVRGEAVGEGDRTIKKWFTEIRQAKNSGSEMSRRPAVG